MKSNLTFAVNELGLVEGYMTHNGQEYIFLTNIFSTPDLFSTYFKANGSLTYEGRLAVKRAKAGRLPEDNQVYHDYCFLSRIRRQAKDILRKGGAA